MNRNSMFSFDLAPHETMRRSVFDLSHSHKTSWNVSELIPIYCCPDILPGDTFSIRTSAVVRLQTLLDPILDDLYLDTYYFFVPNRLLWNHWKEFMGENTSAPWTQTTQYTVPQLKSPASTGWSTGTIADYFGIPIGVADLEVNALPFRAYALVCSEWFRNENIQYPCDCPKDDTTVVGVNTDNQVTDIVKGGKPFKAAKYKDMFTACLPGPQKGADTILPLGNFAPVFTNSQLSPWTSFPKVEGLAPALEWYVRSSGSQSGTSGKYLGTDSNGGTAVDDGQTFDANSDVVPANLFADLTQATGSSVNQLRLAFQIQKMAELDARSGTRYIEKIKAHFGVISPDARMQRPEYLGGHRIALSKISVPQTSQSDTTPQGHIAAYSATVDSHGDFAKSFTEHGVLLGLACVRYKHTYQQGLARGFSRKTIYDYYWPMLANIGEQAIYTKEIYCDNSANDNTVFGYNEAWIDYRHGVNHTSGEMRSTAPTSLDSWHLGDDYASAPSLSANWIVEDKAPVDRVLAVTSSVANQLFGDFYFDIKATRVMPAFSIPGLIDHH